MNSCVSVRAFMYAFMFISGTSKPASASISLTEMMSG